MKKLLKICLGILAALYLAVVALVGWPHSPEVRELEDSDSYIYKTFRRDYQLLPLSRWKFGKERHYSVEESEAAPFFFTTSDHQHGADASIKFLGFFAVVDKAVHIEDNAHDAEIKALQEKRSRARTGTP
ncbi:hypothetical protein [Armatimonas rosea]|uniref:Uncharacterized protein n=1 Tax=Armatimonas rosea TaxID=685828 RepID=A0A7W9SUJ0_ARMRO|nr:hypothetical protein [Armatimonas rosea]MBB6052479.1 hypothetical protein [Armatimonas rosea]